MKKRRLIVVAVLIPLIIILIYLFAAIPIGAGYTAKYLCSQIFIAERDPAVIFDQEIKPTNMLFSIIKFDVNKKEKRVTAAGLGFLRPATAVYREGCGCTLAVGRDPDDLIKEAEGIGSSNRKDANNLWPRGDSLILTSLPQEVEAGRLTSVVEEAFSEPDLSSRRNTQAVVIVYRGDIIAEKYAEGFSYKTPMLSWSMAKSITNMLIGVLVNDGVIDIMKPAPVNEWSGADDPRNNITVDQLLRMSSGLEFDEAYAPFSDATDMLYASGSMSSYAADKPLESKPDTVWNYSSGTANILAKIVYDKTGGSLRSLVNFSRKKLFHEIGAYSALMEPDASGSFVGSSYMFATARDWARFGLLVMNDGVWNGTRILPEGWVEYSSTPTAKSPLGEYGAHFWLNSGKSDNPSERTYPSLPRDMIYFSGFNGQIVAVIPSREIVAVRLGVTHGNAWNDEKFIKGILDSIEY